MSRKKPARAGEPKPERRVDRLALLEAWAEGQAAVRLLADQLDEAAELFRENPDHPGSSWVDAYRLCKVVNALGDAASEMSCGPFLSSFHVPSLVVGGSDEED